MSSLLEIQQEIRQINTDVKRISDDLQNISAEIEKLRRDPIDSIIDFSAIERMSKHISFRSHPLSRLQQGPLCASYIELLISLVRIDNDIEATMNRLVFVQWLQVQSRIDWDLEKLYIEACKTDNNTYKEIIEEIPPRYKEHLIVDSLIIANLSGKAKPEMIEYIVDLAMICGVDDDKMRILALIAKVSLCQSFVGISKSDIALIRDNVSGYRHYISAYIKEEGVNYFRTVVAEMSRNDCMSFKWNVKQYEEVEEGELLATYLKSGLKRIYAPISGVIYMFSINNIIYGVISSKDDNKDSIKEWIKSSEYYDYQ